MEKGGIGSVPASCAARRGKLGKFGDEGESSRLPASTAKILKEWKRESNRASCRSARHAKTKAATLEREVIVISK